MCAIHSIWARYLCSVMVLGCSLLLAVLLPLNLAGCPTDLQHVVLSGVQDTSTRAPPAGLCRVSVVNDASYTAYVTVDRFIDQTLIHHSEAILTPADSGNMNTSLMCDWDEADRVVVAAHIDGRDGTLLWSDEKTYLLGTDFGDGDTIQYTVTLPVPNHAPTASVSGTSQIYPGGPASLIGSSSSDPDGDPLTYQWEQISGTPVTLTGADQATAGFTAPYVSTSETLVFRLTVSDGQLSDTQDWSVVVGVY